MFKDQNLINWKRCGTSRYKFYLPSRVRDDLGLILAEDFAFFELGRIFISLSGKLYFWGSCSITDNSYENTYTSANSSLLSFFKK